MKEMTPTNPVIKSAELYNNSGEMISRYDNSEGVIYLPETAGIYYLQINTGQEIFMKKVVKITE